MTVFSIDAFYNKLKVVDRLVKSKYGKTVHIKKWAKLFGELERLSNTRNCLAHYGSNNYPKGKPGRRFALEPRIVGSRQPQRVPKPPSGAMCLKDIVDAGETFKTMFERLQFLFQELKGEVLPPELAELKPRVMTTEQLTLQIRAMFSKLAAPSST